MCRLCEKSVGNFAQPGLREEERVDGARAEAMGVQGFKDGPGPILHGAESYKTVVI
jgi:hypothetical protein